MTTQLFPGMAIKVAVPLTVGDNTPIGERTETRISKIVDITESGTVHETEGSVSANRMGIDWEPIEGEESAVNLVAVRIASGPILASLMRVEGQSVHLFSDAAIPPGPFQVPAYKCGKCWDWLRGRTVGEVYATLGEVFDPQAKTSAPPVSQGAAPAPAASGTGKKRGPKPRTPIPTATTAALPAEPGPKDPIVAARVVTARDFTFPERAELWQAARVLMRDLDVGEPMAIACAIENLDRTLTEVLKGKAHE
jgi:hypothetical protein